MPQEAEEEHSDGYEGEVQAGHIDNDFHLLAEQRRKTKCFVRNVDHVEDIHPQLQWDGVEIWSPVQRGIIVPFLRLCPGRSFSSQSRMWKYRMRYEIVIDDG